MDPLTAIVDLASFKLNGNNISQLPSLAPFRRISEISLADNALTDLAGFEDLRLDWRMQIDLSGNPLKDLKPLIDLGANEKGFGLILNNVSPALLSEVVKIQAMHELQMQHCSLSDISLLEQRSDLDYLVLSNNSIVDISPLRDFVNVSYLKLDYNQIEDIKPLIALANDPKGRLADVSLLGNPITNKEDLKELRRLVHTVHFDSAREATKPVANVVPKKASEEMTDRERLIGLWRSDPVETEWGTVQFRMRFAADQDYASLIQAAGAGPEDPGQEELGTYEISGETLLLTSYGETRKSRLGFIDSDTFWLEPEGATAGSDTESARVEFNRVK